MRLARLTALAVLGLVLLAAPLSAQRPPAGKVPRLGLLHVLSDRNWSTRLFLDELAKLGWVEGQTVVIEERFARMDQGSGTDLATLAAQLVASQVDVLATWTFAPTTALKAATQTVPIVFSFIGDPVTTGVVASLSRPGGNVTGIATLSYELWAKRLDLLREAVPALSRVGVLWTPADTHPASLRPVEQVATRLGVRLHVFEIRTPDEFEDVFGRMARERVEALLPLGGVMVYNHQRRLVELATKHRLPHVLDGLDVRQTGALMAYSESIENHLRRHAAHLDKVLRGVKPGELPVELPTKFEFVINLRTAKALGLTIPASVLARADEIISSGPAGVPAST